MIRESELRRRLAELISGDVSLDYFEDWYTIASWNSHRDSSAIANRLVGAVELRLAEFSNLHLSFAELMSELRALVIAEPILVATTTSPTIVCTMFVDADNVRMV